MEKFMFAKRVIDRFEEMVIKEIERFIYGTGKICPTALYERLEECIKARKELNYAPVPNNVEELLAMYNFDDEFINEFLERVNNHTSDNCPEL